jgi:hypothetical protein
VRFIQASPSLRLEAAENDMTSKAIIMVGHSHTTAIVDALTSRVASPENSDATNLYAHDVWKRRTAYADSDGKGGVKFNQNILDAIDKIVPFGRARYYTSLLGGNGHILLSLSRHSRPFDVILPENPNLPLESGAEILPYNYLAKMLLNFMLPYIWQLIAFRQAVGVRILHIGPPPPCGNDDYMKTHLGSYIPDPTNIVSRYLRLKMWQIHSSLLADVCAKNDIEFLAAPANSRDYEGFLKAEAYGNDATHANSWYGELLVKHLENVTGSHCGGLIRFTEGDS